MSRTVLISAVSLLVFGGCGNLVNVKSNFTMDAPWAGYERIVVKTANGAVDLAPADNADAEQSLHITGVKTAAGKTVEEANANLAQLTIRAEPDVSDPRTFIIELQFPESIRNRSPGASFTIRTPAAVAASITTGNGAITLRTAKQSATLRTSNGKVIVQDLDGDLDVVTSNGAIHVERVSGKAALETSNGGVIARGVQGTCRIDTSNGDVEVVEARGDVSARTSNGSINVSAQPQPEGSVELVSSNGAIRARLPKTLKGLINLSTSNGSLTTNLGGATVGELKQSKRDFKAALNGGGAGKVIARTSNGEITLDCQ